RMKRRVVTASALGFGALIGLSARHTLGASPHRIHRLPAALPRASRPAAPSTFFDEHDAGAYAFHDEAPAAAATAPPQANPEQGSPSPAPPPPPEPPPVVQSSVS